MLDESPVTQRAALLALPSLVTVGVRVEAIDATGAVLAADDLRTTGELATHEVRNR